MQQEVASSAVAEVVPNAATPAPVSARDDARAAKTFAAKLLGLTLGTVVLVGGFSLVAAHGLGGSGSFAGGAGAARDPHAGYKVPERIGKFDVDPLVGKQLYTRSCATCHGPAGGGMPEQGVALRGSAFVLGVSDSQLLSFVKLGRPAQDPHSITGRAMPPLGGDRQLSQQDLADIVAYIRAMQQAPQRREASASADASRG